MKKINPLGVLVAFALILLTCSCATSKKNTTELPPTPKSEYPCDSARVFTKGWQDSCMKFFKPADWKTPVFYLSQDVKIQRVHKNFSMYVVNGVIMKVDTIEAIIKNFDYRTTSGFMIGIPQSSPGSNDYTCTVKFTNSVNGVTYNLNFKMTGNVYILDRSGKAYFDGKEFEITTHDPALNGQVGINKLIACSGYEKVEIKESQ